MADTERSATLIPPKMSIWSRVLVLGALQARLVAMIRIAKRVLAPLLASLLLALPAQAFDTRASAAFVLDTKTGTILLSKNADQPLPPASMSKLMTLYMAFEAVTDGRLRLQEKLPVSSHAMSYGGSTMFLDTTDRVSVEDLLRGIIVLSGNDACAVIAETLRAVIRPKADIRKTIRPIA